MGCEQMGRRHELWGMRPTKKATEAQTPFEKDFPSLRGFNMRHLKLLLPSRFKHTQSRL
jgi:hypothetical protein